MTTDTTSPTEALRGAHARLARVADGLAPSALEREAAVGEWPPRDVACHLADWLSVAAEVVRRGLAEPPGEPLAREQVAHLNATTAGRYAGWTWSASLAQLDRAVEELAALVDGLAADEQQRAIRLPWGETATPAQVVQLLAAHHDQHAAELEHWRATRFAKRG
jgi:hypothetical protein